MATGRILILIETSQHSRLGGIIDDIPFHGILFAILMLLLVELLEKMKQFVPLCSYAYTTGALVNGRVVASSNYINERSIYPSLNYIQSFKN